MDILKDSIYTELDGSTVHVRYAPKAMIEKDLGKQLSDAEYEEHCISRAIPEHATNVIHRINEEDLPKEYELFNAWVINPVNKKIEIHPEKAKQIRQDAIIKELNKTLTDKNLKSTLGDDVSVHDAKINDLRKQYSDLKGN